MRFNLYKMTLQGKIATANMLLVCIVVVTFRIFFPDMSVHVDTASKELLALASVLEVITFVLTFPLGLSVPGPSLLAVIIVPLNAYLWGYSAATLVGWLRAIVRKPSAPDPNPQ